MISLGSYYINPVSGRKIRVLHYVMIDSVKSVKMIETVQQYPGWKMIIYPEYKVKELIKNGTMVLM